MNVYNYLFFRIYKRQNTRYSKNESAIFASIVVSCLLYLNLFTIGIFLFKYNVIPLFISSKTQAIVFIFILLLINIAYFNWKKKYLAIENKFLTLSICQNKIGLFLIFTYLIASLLFFIIGVNLK